MAGAASTSTSSTTLLTNQPVVLDNGTGVCKAGFAGADAPRVQFGTLVGEPKYKRVMLGAVSGERFVGAKADELRGLLGVSYPMEHGVVRNWRDMELVWQHAYNELRIAASDHPLLLTESPVNPTKHRERAAQVLFEAFGVPALYVSAPAVLALYASGRTTGCVLDAGDGTTTVTPVFEGFAVPHAVVRHDVGGRDVTRHLQLLLRKAGHCFRTSAEFEIVRTIKEKACYVALDAAKEESGLFVDAADKPLQLSYKLPDGNVIELGAERFRAPELLFRPALVGDEALGVHDALAACVARADMDLRRTLYANIVLTGGSTLFAGFPDRLLAETRAAAPPNTKIRIAAGAERTLATWRGGSILASLGNFRSMWVERATWQEEGAAAVRAFGL